jgi:hypothetical protein
VLWLCGARAVGKSTVGWQLWLQTVRRPQTAGFADLEQLGFLRPALPDDPHNHRVKAGNLAALWRNYRAVGARSLVVVGSVDDTAAVRTYQDALPGAALTLTRLHAGPGTLADRVLARARGEGPGIPGDELLGLDPPALAATTEHAAATAAALELAALGDPRVNTDGRTVAEVVAEILARTGHWPGVSE